MKILTSILKAFSPNTHVICTYSCQPLRYLSQGSLVVRRPTQISVSKKSSKKTIKKLFGKKYLGKIKHTRAKLENEENLWLETLSLENLKLYRKTEKNRYKIINNDRLFEKLAVLKLLQLEDQKKNDSINSFKQSASIKSSDVSKQESDQTKPKPSDFLIKNMLEFPFLKVDFRDLEIDKSVKDESLKFLFKDAEEKEINSLPSVTKILSDTMSIESKFRLNQWQTKMINELGESGFNKYKKDLKNQGAMFHGSIKKYLETDGQEEVRIDPTVEGCWESIRHCLVNISDVKLLEQPLRHPLLLYRGVVDCVASYRKVPCVIEWKKSEKKKSDLKDTYDAPIQMCAYMGALSWAQDLKLTPLRNGLVVVAYTDGSPADLFLMNLETCESYWREWLRRLQDFWSQRISASVQKEPPAKNLFSEYS